MLFMLKNVNQNNGVVEMIKIITFFAFILFALSFFMASAALLTDSEGRLFSLVSVFSGFFSMIIFFILGYPDKPSHET